MKTYTEINETTTIITAKRRTGRGWETFTLYQDAEDRFVSYHKVFATREEAEAYALKLIAKLAR